MKSSEIWQLEITKVVTLSSKIDENEIKNRNKFEKTKTKRNIIKSKKC